jgi:hypothetical protein
MDFAVKRLVDEHGGPARYHLFDRSHKLILVADAGTPWVAADARKQVRFAQPDGRQITTLDLSLERKKDPKKDAQHAAYPLVLEHAVYAIVNEYVPLPAEGKKPPLPYYILEVEGDLWLVRGERGVDPYYSLYDQIPTTMTTFQSLAIADLPERFGAIHEVDLADYNYTIDLDPGRLQNTGLIVLALVFLIDRER